MKHVSLHSLHVSTSNVVPGPTITLIQELLGEITISFYNDHKLRRQQNDKDRRKDTSCDSLTDANHPIKNWRKKHESGKRKEKVQNHEKTGTRNEWEAKWMKANRPKDEQIIMYIYREEMRKRDASSKWEQQWFSCRVTAELINQRAGCINGHTHRCAQKKKKLHAPPNLYEHKERE